MRRRSYEEDEAATNVSEELFAMFQEFRQGQAWQNQHSTGSL